MSDVIGQADMAEASTAQNALQSFYPKHREALINQPGLVTTMGERGYWSGGRKVTFKDGKAPTGLLRDAVEKLASHMQVEGDADWGCADSQFNAFFECFGNIVATDWRIGAMGAIHLIFTNQFDEVELEDMKFAGEVLSRVMAERRQQREVVANEAREAAAKEMEETAALVELGKKARDHNLLGKKAKK